MTAIATVAAESSRIPLPHAASPTVWVSFPDGSVSPVDTIAVDRAVNGERSGWTLTAAEILYAAPFMFDAVPYSIICARLGVSAKRFKQLFPGVAPETERGTTAECGTRRGYDRHKRHKETACEPCKAAYAEAYRHYRAHGTYVTAPGVAA